MNRFCPEKQKRFTLVKKVTLAADIMANSEQEALEKASTMNNADFTNVSVEEKIEESTYKYAVFHETEDTVAIIGQINRGEPLSDKEKYDQLDRYAELLFRGGMVGSTKKNIQLKDGTCDRVPCIILGVNEEFIYIVNWDNAPEIK